MASTVKVLMLFTADTNAAKLQINELLNLLKQLTLSTGNNLVFGNKFELDIIKAQKSVRELGTALERSLDVDTGKLNLTKLSTELNKSGKNLKDFGADLSRLGPLGQLAFLSLTRLIMQANVLITSTNKFIASMWTNLKNVAKWQVSSAVLTSFTKAFSDAFSYAKDLNESLNNIRIVSGLSTILMAQFAKEANKAAKALSTTTTEYTNASLIFYQLGLTGDAVKERAEVVTKMANVTGLAAQEVSDLMTAVWNNFDNGSKSLEYYADVLTALGAATASSTDEIATGLEKFAATAETVGLSYEYAASALATVTATTRQSADIVGTAFKTLFARILDLELGKTLDDGTTLGKYSEALNVVGVNIKDTNGGLKDMDDILDATAAKWDKLSRDLKTALALTVAGTRLYTQFMALMDNWDFMEENLDTTANATGELQNQQEIFEEGWEGASKRVKASFEGIYDSLINDEFIIDLIDGFAKFLNGIEKVIDSMGGFKGLLAGLVPLMTKLFGSLMLSGIANMALQLHSFTKAGKAEATALKTDAYLTAINMIPLKGSLQNQLEALLLKDLLTLDLEFSKSSNLTPELLAALNLKKEILAVSSKNLGALREEKVLLDSLQAELEDTIKIYDKKLSKLESEQKHYLNLANLSKDKNYNDHYQKNIDRTGISHSDAHIRSGEDEEKYTARLMEGYKGAASGAAEYETKVRSLYRSVDRMTDSGREAMKASAKLESIEKDIVLVEGKRSKKITELNEVLEQNNKVTEEGAKAQLNYNNILNKPLNPNKYANMAKTFLDTTSAVSLLTMGLTSLGSIWKTLKDPDMSGWLKTTSIIMSLSMGLPMLFTGFSKLLGIMQSSTLVTNLFTAATTSSMVAENGAAAVKRAMVVATMKQTEAERIAVLLERLGCTVTLAKTLLENKSLVFKKALKAATDKLTFATIKQTIADGIHTTVIKIKEKAILALNSKMMKMFIVIGIIVAAIAILVKSVQMAIDAYNADAIAAEKAAEASKVAAEEFNNAKLAYEDFMNTSKAYDDAIVGLAKLTKGTIEYKELIVKANEEALKLINSLDMLYGRDYQYNEDGLIEINDSAMLRARLQEFANLQKAESYKAFSSQRAKDAQAKADMVQYNRDNLRTGGDAAAAAGKAGAYTVGGAALGAGAAALSAMAIGAAVGSTVPIVGTIVGAIAGLSAGIYTAIKTYGASTDAEEKAMTTLADAYNQMGEAAFTPEKMLSLLSAQGVDLTLIDKLIELSQDLNSGLREQIIALSENTTALRGAIEATVGTANQDNINYQLLSEEDKTIMDKVVANRSDDILKDEDSDAYKEARKVNEKLFDWSDQNAYDKYLEARFGDDAKNYLVVHLGGSNATLLKKNAEGAWENVGEENSLSNDEVLDFLTQWDLILVTEEDLAKLTRINEASAKMVGMANGIDPDAIFDIESALANGEMVDFTLMSPELVEGIKANIDQFGEEFKGLIQAGIDNYSEEAHKARLEKEADSILGTGAAELETTKSALEAYTDVLMEENEAYADNKKLAAEAAVETFRFSKELAKLETVVKDNIKNIKNFDKNNLECYESLGLVKEALQDTFGLEIDADFVKENIDLITKAAEGNLEAINQLGFEMSKNYVENLEVASENLDAFFDKDFDVGEGLKIGDEVYQSVDAFTSHFDTVKNNVLGYIDEISNASLGIGDNISKAIGEEDVLSFVNSLNEMAAMTNMSVDEMQSMLSSMGVLAVVDLTWVDLPVKVPVYRTEEKVIKAGNWFTGDGRITETTTRQVREDTMDGGRYVASISYDGSNPATLIRFTGGKKALSTPSSYKSSSSGGGGSKPKQPQEVERYTNINNALEENNHLREKNSKINDHKIGLKRVLAINAENESLKENNKLLQLRLDLAKYNLKEIDQKEILKYFNFEFAEDGTILNEEAFTAWINSQEIARQNTYDAAAKAYNAMTAELQQALGEDYKENLDKDFEKSDEYIEAAREAMDQYKETLGIVRDTELEILDNNNQILSNNMEAIIETFETLMEIIERSMDNIEHRMSILNKDALGLAKSLALSILKAPLFIALALVANDAIWEILEKYNNPEKYNGGLHDDEAYEQLLNLADSLYSTIGNIKEYIDETYHGLLAVIEANAEEFEKYTSYFEDLSSAIDHYNTIMELTGKGKNYKAINEALRTQGIILKANAESSLKYYTELSSQLEQAKEKLTSANKEERKAALARVDVLAPKVAEAYDKMLSDAETFALKWQEILANGIEEAAKKLEEELTEGLGFEALSRDIEFLQSQEEVFLTNTNKTYETTKLIRSVLADIDSSTNKAHLAKLKAFLKETELLKNQDRLSRDELEIQLLKYDLLIAEIALEDARDAKNKVRLMRDSQGNFNYVYTADQNAINDAQQKVDDANNALYNKYLDVTNSNAERIQLVLQEFAEEAAALDTSDPNYLNNLSDLLKKAIDKITMYQDLYAIGAEGLGNKIDEAWTTSILSSIDSVEDFQIATNNFISSATASYKEYYDEVEWVSEYANADLNSMSTTATNLKNTIADEVVPGIKTSMDEALGYIEKFASESAPHLQEVITKYEKIAEAAEIAAYSIAGFDKNSNIAQKMLEAESEDEFWTLAKFRTTKMAMYGMSPEEYGSNLDIYEQWKAKPKKEETKTEELPKEIPQASETSNTTSPTPKETVKTDTRTSEQRVNDLYNLIISGKLGTGWNNRLAKAKELGYTEAEFNQVKDRINGELSPSTTTKRPLVTVKEPTLAEIDAMTLVDKDDAKEFKILDGKVDVGDKIKILTNGPKTTINAYYEKNGQAYAFNDTLIGYGLTGTYLGDKKINQTTYYRIKIAGKEYLIHSAYADLAEAFDTGGYTGKWGPEGRWAMLHEKELVLNKDDTANFLDALELTRSVLLAVDLNTIASQYSLTGKMAAATFTDAFAPIQQDVHITAEFPNATDKEEIKAAFDNIINEAVLYAGIKRV